MPAKSLWLERLPAVIADLEARAESWVDRATLESLLGVGRRRAQQLLARIPCQRVGTSMLASRDDVVAHLRVLSSGDDAYYEQRRQERLWDRLEEARRQWTEQPPVLVQVPQRDVRGIEAHDFAALPEGVELAPGSIIVRFQSSDEALQKLMALAIAIGHNPVAFESRVAPRKSPSSL
jgi:hypothetical protein